MHMQVDTSNASPTRISLSGALPSARRTCGDCIRFNVMGKPKVTNPSHADSELGRHAKSTGELKHVRVRSRKNAGGKCDAVTTATVHFGSRCHLCVVVGNQRGVNGHSAAIALCQCRRMPTDPSARPSA